MWTPIDTMQKSLGTKYSPVNMYKTCKDTEKMNCDLVELDMFKQKLGVAVKNVRMEKQLSFIQVAERSKSSKSYIWALENGLANPSIYKLTVIAKALGTDISSLLI